MVYWVRSSRVFRLTTGLILVAMAMVGCSPATDPQNALAPAGPVERMEANLYTMIFWMAVAVFIIVEGLLIYTIVRYRAKRPGEMPVQTHGNTRLEIIWTIIPFIILAVIAVPTMTTIASATAPQSGPGTLNVRVVGHQWWWEFDYPDLGIVTSDELHVPTGTKVNLDVESADVIHSFWIPKLGGKVQAIPNQHNSSWIEADDVGKYMAQCYQLCGTSHANMRFIVVSQSKTDFDAWVKGQTTPPVKSTDPAVQKGAQIFATGACIGCHTLEGTPANAKVGPNLTHIGSHETLAGATLQNTPKDLALWLHDPPGVKPGSIMPNLGLTDDQVNSLVAYLESLK